MYAIQNIITGKFVYGTDYRYYPPHQKTSLTQMLTYEWLAYAKSDFLHRKCSTNNYRIVKLKPVEVERVIDLDSEVGYEIQKEDWEENA